MSIVLEGITKTFEPELNFWEVHPNLLIITEFKKFQNRDRSKDNSRSSREMWGFAFLYDMDKANFLRHGDEITRMDNISRQVLFNEKYDWDKEEDVREKMRELCQPDPQRMLYDLKKKIDERLKFINETPYTLDKWEYNEKTQKNVLIKGTADQLDKMMINTGKLFEQWEYWNKQITLERERRKQPKQLSATDTGEI